MESTTKRTVRFEGGPLDGQTKEVAVGETTYILQEHPDIEDLTMAEPIGLNPASFEIVYKEEPEGSGVFVVKE